MSESKPGMFNANDIGFAMLNDMTGSPCKKKFHRGNNRLCDDRGNRGSNCDETVDGSIRRAMMGYCGRKKERLPGRDIARRG